MLALQGSRRRVVRHCLFFAAPRTRTRVICVEVVS
jgi:hypothetical protein